MLTGDKRGFTTRPSEVLWKQEPGGEVGEITSTGPKDHVERRALLEIEWYLLHLW